MPSQMWDTPFGYDKGNKEFPEAEKAKKMPAKNYEDSLPSGPCPIDSPIASLKLKQDVPVNETEGEGLSTNYNASTWDTPFTNRHSIGSTYPED